MKPERTPFFGQRRLRLRSLRLRDALFLTLPLWLALAYPLISAVADYDTMHAYDDWFVAEYPLSKLVRTRFSAPARLPKARWSHLMLDSNDRDPAAIHLQVDRRDWRIWQAEPDSLWGEWLDAKLVDGKNIRPVNIRKRGDTSVHWLTEKKSMTLKTKRDQPFRGYRRLALSGKTVLQQVFTNSLAHEFDLLAPTTTLAPVYVNKKFYGLFRATEVIDESFLRRHERLPGNIYRGDTAEPGELFRGLPRNLFVNPTIWDRVAFNDRPSAPGPRAMADFIRDQNGSTFDDHMRWLNRLDQHEMARLMAYLLIVGDPYHLTDLHNQFWYEDPSTGKLHPIPWDIRAFRLDYQGRLNEAQRAALENPFIVDEMMRTIAASLKDDAIISVAERLVLDLNARHQDYIRYERTRSESIPRMGTLEAPLEILRFNVDVLRGWLTESDVAFHAQTTTRGVSILDFAARGRVGANLEALTTQSAEDGQPLPRLFADANRNGRLDDADRQVPLRATSGRLVLLKPEPLLPGIRKQPVGVEPAGIHYRFFLVSDEPTTTVTPHLTHRISKGSLQTSAWAANSVIGAPHGWHPWQYVKKARRDIRLAGDVHLTKTLTVNAQDTLRIEEGTRIRLDPDVSILAYGRVVALGSAERPISIKPTTPRAPWGVFALQGPGANDSVFEHVSFEGGGGATLGGVEYKGMVCIHHALKVRFQGCEFSRNLRCDDSFNGVFAEVEILDSKFTNTNADALDLDHSSGRVLRNVFKNSGNDGLDLMTSSPLVENNRIIGSGDKGISIGERSDPTVINNHIEGGPIGAAVKDASRPEIVSNTFAHNGVAIFQGAKNWRYATGGSARLIGNRFNNNTMDFDFDSKSTVSVLAHRPSWSGTPTKTQVQFQENLSSSTDDWSAEGGATKLRKRGYALVADLRRERGHISQTLDWTTEVSSVLVVEVGGAGFTDGVVAVTADGGVVQASFERQPARRFGLVELELGPGHYSNLRLSATPTTTSARLKLRGYSHYEVPQPAE